MSKLERLKEELAIQKQLFFVSLAVIFAIMGWFATHSGSVSWWLGVASFLGIIGGVVFGYSRYRPMYQLLKEIEDA